MKTKSYILITEVIMEKYSLDLMYFRFSTDESYNSFWFNEKEPKNLF